MSRKRQNENSGKPLTEAQAKWLLGEVSDIVLLCAHMCPFKDSNEMRVAWFANRTKLLRRAKGTPWAQTAFETDYMQQSRERIRAALKKMDKKRKPE